MKISSMLKRIPLILVIFLSVSVAMAQNRGRSADLPSDLQSRLGVNKEVFSDLSTRYKAYRSKVNTARSSANGNREAFMKSANQLKVGHLTSAREILNESQLSEYEKFLNKRGNRRGGADDKLVAKLNLTEDQSKKFKAVNKSYQTMVFKLRAEYEGDRSGLLKALQPLREKRNSMMKSFLTESQYEVYLQELEKAKKNHHH